MSANVTELPRAGRHTTGPDIAEIKAFEARAREKRSALPPAVFPHRFFGFYYALLISTQRSVGASEAKCWRTSWERWSPA